jgi:hypothetical protein
VSLSGHTVEQVEGVTEQRSLSNVVTTTNVSGILPMGTVLLETLGTIEVVVVEPLTRRP